MSFHDEMKMSLDGKKIVFIVGAARSGTTWLQFLLQQSPHVAGTSNETHLFDTYIKRLFGMWEVSRGRVTGIQLLISDQEFEDWVNALVRTCFRRIAESKPGARVVLEKTPPHCACGPEILRCLPDSYFIHIIRDPRAAVASMRTAACGWGAHWAPKRIREACGSWASWVTQARSIAALTPRYCELFYEQLHADTPGEIMRLFDWLGEPIDRAQAEAHATACTLDGVREQAMSGDAKGKISEPMQFFRRGEVDSWREELSATEIAIVERLTKKHMTRLGYEPVAGRRAKLEAYARIKTYRTANRLAERMAKAVRAGADWIKP
jgi:LPS sulfotransferase NodH